MPADQGFSEELAALTRKACELSNHGKRRCRAQEVMRTLDCEGVRGQAWRPAL
jgi:hypothetical protein